MRQARVISESTRAELVRAVAQAPLGYRIAIEEPVRTNSQNRLMWSLLQSFAEQVVHCGRKYEAEAWKCIFMKALGKEFDFAPSLEGDEIVAIGYRSSRLSKEEMANLVELIYSEGAKRGVVFHGEAA